MGAESYRASAILRDLSLKAEGQRFESAHRLHHSCPSARPHGQAPDVRIGAMLETCGSAGKGCTFPVSELRSQ
jgi:hypothetical protein